jgi:hypothetical protein
MDLKICQKDSKNSRLPVLHHLRWHLQSYFKVEALNKLPSILRYYQYKNQLMAAQSFASILEYRY